MALRLTKSEKGLYYCKRCRYITEQTLHAIRECLGYYQCPCGQNNKEIVHVEQLRVTPDDQLYEPAFMR